MANLDFFCCRKKITIKFALLPIALIFGFAFFGCTRPISETKSKINILFPLDLENSSAQSIKAFSTTKLSHLVINVTGPGIAVPIVINWDSCRTCPVTQSTESFFMEIPSGSNRLIQVLAVYVDQDSETMRFFYGDLNAELNQAEMGLDIPVAKIGTGPLVMGNVAGRYLTGQDSGPTGIVNIRYNPGVGRPPLLIERAAIYNGWFSFFMLSGAALEYQLAETGQLLWGRPMDLDQAEMSPASASLEGAFTRLAKVFVPVHVRVQNYGGSNTYSVEDAGIYVWGYWGQGAAAKAVCTVGLNANPNLTKLAKFSVVDPSTSPVLTIKRNVAAAEVVPTAAELLNVTTPYSMVVVQGGGGSDMASSCGGFQDTAANQYLNFQKISLDLFDGEGRDRISGFYGFLRRDFTSGQVLNISSTTKSISGQVLPGVETVISGMRSYKRVSSDNFRLDSAASCNEISRGMYGYVPADAAAAPLDVAGAFMINTNITAADATQGVSSVLCPIVGGTPSLAGLFIDKWRFSPTSGGGGGGTVGGGGSGPPVALKVYAPVAMGGYECQRMRLAKVDALGFDTNQGLAPVNVNLSVDNVNAALFAISGTPCSGTAVTSASFTIPAGQAGIEFELRTPSPTPATVVVTATDTAASSPLASSAPTIAVRGYGYLVSLNYDLNTVMNMNSCRPASVRALGPGAALLTGNSDPFSLVVEQPSGGAALALYSDSGCGTPISSTGGIYTLNFNYGVSSFYIKATTLGFVSMVAQKMDGTLNFVSRVGLKVVPTSEPTQLLITDEGSSPRLYGYCLKYALQSVNDAGTPIFAPGIISMMANHTSGGYSNFFTDAACATALNTSTSLDVSGHRDIWIRTWNGSPGPFIDFGLAARLENATMYPIEGKFMNQTVTSPWIVNTYDGQPTSFGGTHDTSPSDCREYRVAVSAISTGGTGTYIANYSGSPVVVNVSLLVTTAPPVNIYSDASCTTLMIDGTNSGQVASGLTLTIPNGDSVSNTVYVRSTNTGASYDFGLQITNISSALFSGSYSNFLQIYLVP